VQIRINGKLRDVPQSVPLRQLLEEMDLPSKQVAVEVNHELIPRQKHPDYIVQSGDELEIVTLAGGG